MTFSDIFARVGSQSLDMAFEVRFAAMQRNLVNRANEEIDKLQKADKTHQKLAALEKRRGELVETLPQVRQYLFAVTANVDRIGGMQTDAQDLLSLMQESDGSLKASFTAEEAAEINSRKESLTASASDVFYLYHPDISGGSTVLRLRDSAEEAAEFSATEGAVPAEDDPNPANQNRALYEALKTFANAADVAYTGALDAREQASELSIDLQTGLTEVEAEAAMITQVSSTELIDKIDGIKSKYANMLKAISLSFEASRQLTNYLQTSLSEQRPQAGSVVNLFT